MKLYSFLIVTLAMLLACVPAQAGEVAFTPSFGKDCAMLDLGLTVKKAEVGVRYAVDYFRTGHDYKVTAQWGGVYGKYDVWTNGRMTAHGGCAAMVNPIGRREVAFVPEAGIRVALTKRISASVTLMYCTEEEVFQGNKRIMFGLPCKL